MTAQWWNPTSWGLFAPPGVDDGSGGPPGGPPGPPPDGLLTSNDRLGALSQALLGAGAGLLTQDPHQRPSFAAAVGRGVAGFAGGLNEGVANARRDQYTRAQLGDMKDARADRARARDLALKEQQQIDAFVATLPPGEQAMAKLAPKEVILARIKELYPDPDKAPSTSGDRYYDTKTRTWVRIPGVFEDKLALAAAGRNPPNPDSKSQDDRDDAILRAGDRTSPQYAQVWFRKYRTLHMAPGSNAGYYDPVPPGILPPSGVTDAGGASGAFNAGTGGGAARPGQVPTVTFATDGPAPLSPAMKAKYAEQTQLLDKMDNTIGAYEKALKADGTSIAGAVGIPTRANSRVSSAYTSMLIELKSLNELGVLNGHDYELLVATLADPNSRNGVILGVPGLQDQIKGVRDRVQFARAALKKNYLGEDPGQVAAPTSQAEFDALPSGAKYRDPGDPPGSTRTKP